MKLHYVTLKFIMLKEKSYITYSKTQMYFEQDQKILECYAKNYFKNYDYFKNFTNILKTKSNYTVIAVNW